MAGKLPTDSHKPADILFDLNIEDDQNLSKSELLQLVNYGQMQKSVQIPGADGTTYNVEMALLWDEDHVDILRKTSSYAGDPVLRVRIMRRLKLHKAIQTINSIDFSDKDNPIKQRLLWNVLNKLSEQQMEYLNTLYEQISIDRDMQTFQALKQMSKELSDTAPKDIKPKENTVVMSESQLAEHEAFIASKTQQQEQDAVGITKVITEKAGIIPAENKPESPRSPKQNPNRRLDEEQ